MNEIVIKDRRFRLMEARIRRLRFLMTDLSLAEGDSSCARQRALSSNFKVSESLLHIRTHRKCTSSKSRIGS